MQRGEVDVLLTLAGPPDIADRNGTPVVTLLRPMTSAQMFVVVPSMRNSSMIDKAVTFLKPFDLVCFCQNVIDVHIVFVATYTHTYGDHLAVGQNKLALHLSS